MHPPAKFVLDDENRRGMAVNSMVSGGCIISGASVSNSMLFSDVRVDDGSHIDGAVVMPSVSIGRRCQLRRCIIDEGCTVPDGMQIGLDPAVDKDRFFITKNGVVLVTRNMLAKLLQAPA
jgi:glucose-1-phosphate adenylyltransferase